jgi:acyl carrier protein
MTNSPLAHAIAAHIETAAFLAPGELDAAEPLFSSGIIDSITLVDLVVFIEQQAGISVPPRDIALEYFDSVERIMAYLARKRGH